MSCWQEQNFQPSAGQKFAWLGTIEPTGANNTLQHHS